MTPSTTMGSAVRPIGSSKSTIQVSPSRETLLVLMSFRGLNCCCQKLPPLTNQLSPDFSRRTRASLTLAVAAGIAGVAASIATGTIAASAKRKPRRFIGAPLKEGQCNAFDSSCGNQPLNDGSNPPGPPTARVTHAFLLTCFHCACLIAAL